MDVPGKVSDVLPEAPKPDDSFQQMSWLDAMGLAVQGTMWAWVLTMPLVGILGAGIFTSLAVKNVWDWTMVALLFFAVVPGIAVGYLTGFGARRLQLETYRKKRGLCLRCGYDLRATTGRCPECGGVRP